MQWYYQIIGYFGVLLALGLLFYRLKLLFTGNHILGVVTNIVIRNRTLTSITNSKLIEISYKNTKGVSCKFEADNGLLVFLYQIGDSIRLSEKNGKVMVSSLFNIITAPLFIFIMSFVVLNFLT